MEGADDGDFAGQSAWSLQRLVDSPQLFERFLYGLALVDRDGGVRYLNQKARQLLVPASRASAAAPWRCCDLICSRLAPVDGDACMSEQAMRSEPPLPEVRMDIEQGRLAHSAWVTASPIDAGTLLFHLRPGRLGDRRRRTPLDWPHLADRRSELRIVTLGGLRVEGLDGPIGGEWLGQRPGQLLKYMVVERHRVAASDQIAEALWPEAGPSESRSRLRYYVHMLREKLEPGRARRSPSRFIVAQGGGYALDTGCVWIDADAFEREARAGLAAFAQGSIEPAAKHLRDALRLYQDRFLPDDLYEDWLLDERERLHELAGRALRVKVEILVQQGRLEAAADRARRLVEMEPFDTDVQKMFIDICLRRGRRSEALRRYAVLRKRMLASFGQEPGFDLAELDARINRESS
ncbi:MAG: BTAD domain-containing putative transcriptional regulator [Solirubrobacterales bacterium]